MALTDQNPANLMLIPRLDWAVAWIQILNHKIATIQQSGGGGGGNMQIGNPVIGASPNMFLITDESSNLSETTSPIAIGVSVAGATPGNVLRTDESGNLADEGISYDGGILTVSANQLKVTGAGASDIGAYTDAGSYVLLAADDANTTGGLYYKSDVGGEYRIVWEGTGSGTATIQDGDGIVAFITDISDYVASIAGVANGLATLDSGGTVPIDQLPFSVSEYLGTWDASTNDPTLADGVGNNGDFYVVSVGGTQDLGSGNITFAAGNLVIYNGALTIWQKAGGLATGTVTSVSSADNTRCTVANGSTTPVIEIVSAPILTTARSINNVSFDGSANILLNQSINAQTGTTYTFVLSDNQKLVTATNSSSQTYTVPPNASVAFPIGAQIDITVLGTGAVTFAQGAGVTIRSKGGLLTTNGQYTGFTLKKIATNEWVLFGDLV